MKPAKPPAQEPDGLFKTPLERFIDMQHPLVVLADRIDWDALDAGIVGCFGTTGRPAVPTRFMLGMLILKATYDLSDQAYFLYEVSHERSGLSHWRNRLGTDILCVGALSKRDMEVVTVDIKVQKKVGAVFDGCNLALYRARESWGRSSHRRDQTVAILCACR